jgi:hypothetical protein
MLWAWNQPIMTTWWPLHTLLAYVLLTLTIGPSHLKASCQHHLPLLVYATSAHPSIPINAHHAYHMWHLFWDHALLNSPLLYIASLYSFVYPWLPFLFRLLPCMLYTCYIYISTCLASARDRKYTCFFPLLAFICLSPLASSFTPVTNLQPCCWSYVGPTQTALWHLALHLLSHPYTHTHIYTLSLSLSGGRDNNLCTPPLIQPCTHSYFGDIAWLSYLILILNSHTDTLAPPLWFHIGL